MRFDMTTKPFALCVVLGLDLLFLTLAIASMLAPSMAPASARLWELFAGTNSALFLALNTSGHPPSPAGPTAVGA